jgi:hypothetical protein
MLGISGGNIVILSPGRPPEPITEYYSKSGRDWESEDGRRAGRRRGGRGKADADADDTSTGDEPSDEGHNARRRRGRRGHDIDPGSDDTPTGDEAMTDADKELEASKELKDLLPDAMDRRKFMDWLKSGHNEGIPHDHLRRDPVKLGEKVQQWTEEGRQGSTGGGKYRDQRRQREQERQQGSGAAQQTAAEGDWEGAQSEVDSRDPAQQEPKNTEHGAIREAGRGALTPSELHRLQGQLPHIQPDGAVARVLNEGHGQYTVAIHNEKGQLISVVREMTKAAVRNMARKNGWAPPYE